MSVITSTSFILPQSVVSNGQVTGNEWLNPDYMLLVDGLLSESDSNAGSASDVILGNYNVNLPQNAVVTGIEMELIAKSGAPAIPAQTLTIYAVDNTSGQDIFYPYTAPQSLTEDLTTYILGSSTYVFDTALTPDQVNNIKFQLVANGDIYVDSFLVKVFYYIPDVPTPPTPTEGCATCNSPIQVQRMALQQPFLNGDTKFYLKPGSMTYPDGTPIQPEDLGDCGGVIDFVFDQGKSKGTTGNDNFEENVQLDISTGYWTVLPSGVVEVSLGSINDRGLQFHTPYGHDANLMSDHDANSEVIISNNAVYEGQKLRLCQKGTVFSEPIDVQKDGSDVVNPAKKFNFIGAGVSVADAGSGEADITIPGFSPIPPNVENELAFYNNTQVSSYSTPSFDVTGTDRLLMVALTIESGIAPTLTWNGDALISVTSSTIGTFTCWVFYLVAPDLGTHTLDMTFDAPTLVAGNIVLYTQVDQSTPLSTDVAGGGSSTTASLSPTTTTQNSIVFHAVSTRRFPILYTAGGGESMISSSVAGTLQNGVENQSVGTPAMVTTQISLSVSTDWSDIALGINGIQPTPAVESVTDDGNNVVSVDNADPANPVVKFNGVYVDGSSISGDGTQGNPLTANGDGDVQSVNGYYVDNSDPQNPIITVPKNNLTNSAPGVNDDNTQDYSVGSEWFDTSTNTLYIAEDVSTGAAVWATVSIAGTANPYSVNADETVVTFDTHEVRLPVSGAILNGWGAIAGGVVQHAFDILYQAWNSTAMAILLSGTDAAGAAFQYDTGKIVRMKFRAAVDHGSAFNGDKIGIGFGDGTTNFPDETTIERCIKFVWRSVAGVQTLFTVTADGTTNTNNSFTGAIAARGALNIYEIVWTSTTSVEFYVNGTLLVTHTTNIPSSSDQVKIMMVNDNLNTGLLISNPVLSIEA